MTSIATPKDWNDYELIDAGFGEKLERWGQISLVRPDPQVLWPRDGRDVLWTESDAQYIRSKSGGGKWNYKHPLPEHWPVSYKKLKFLIRPTGFKHTGLFPEQAVNWDWMMPLIEKAGRPIKVLNLFAYTGGATVACAAAGAEVTHVDAAKGMVEWAKDNIKLSGLTDKPVRFIVDDVAKFVAREKRRGTKYDAIIMDPPSYGRGTEGETWKIEKMLWPLLADCKDILSENPLFFLINSYTTGLSPTVISNLLATLMKDTEGKISSGEIGLPITVSGKILPAGIYGRWEK